MFEQYKDRVSFYLVYINEAHPTDIWQMQSNIKDGVLFRQPTSDTERENVAESCVRKLHIPIPALLDSIQNKVEADYTAWPDRLYVMDKSGTVRYKSAPGPFGFDAKQLAAAIKSL